MKKTLLLFVCFFALIQLNAKNGEKNDFGYQVNDTLFLNDGNKFVIGEKLYLGHGTSHNKSFTYVYISPNNWVSVMGGNVDRYLPATWANNELQIKDFKLYGRKKTGYKWYIVVGGGNIVNYWCEINEALEAGEVITPITQAKKAEQNQPIVIQQATSKADELKKLKELLEEGILTQEEFDTEKQKILNS